MRFNLGALIAGAMSAFGELARHDMTGTLSNPDASLKDKAEALVPAMENAGVDIVDKGLTDKLGPEGAIVAEIALPMLNSVISAANAKIAQLTASPQNDVIPGS